MPDINFHLRMKQKYFRDLSETEQEILEKGFDNTALSSLGSNRERHFIDGFESNVSLLFIDISHFSTRMKKLTGTETATYFSGYYDIIFPIVFSHGGIVERVIGDGIVVLFGKPFSSLSPTEVLIQVDKCAKQILLATNGTKYSSKIAFHNGRVRYFKNQSGYEDYTIIGTPLTDLFRLESICVDNAINYFNRGTVKIFYDTISVNNWPEGQIRKGVFVEYYEQIQPPKGTDYTGLCHIQHIN